MGVFVTDRIMTYNGKGWTMGRAGPACADFFPATRCRAPHIYSSSAAAAQQLRAQQDGCTRGKLKGVGVT